MIYTVAYGGERLDRIAKTLLQTEKNGAVEALLKANPGLATVSVGGVVPQGTEITPPTDWAPAPDQTFVIPWE